MDISNKMEVMKEKNIDKQCGENSEIKLKVSSPSYSTNPSSLPTDPISTTVINSIHTKTINAHNEMKRYLLERYICFFLSFLRRNPPAYVTPAWSGFHPVPWRARPAIHISGADAMSASGKAKPWRWPGAHAPTLSLPFLRFESVPWTVADYSLFLSRTVTNFHMAELKR